MQAGAPKEQPFAERSASTRQRSDRHSTRPDSIRRRGITAHDPATSAIDPRANAAGAGHLMGHRTAGLVLLLCFSGSVSVSAQATYSERAPAQGTPSAQQPGPPTPPDTPATAPLSAPQEPVAVTQTSEERGFLRSLFSQLGQDLKHMPRRNSLYWLAAGSGLALAVHPADDDINARLVGSDFAYEIQLRPFLRLRP